MELTRWLPTCRMAGALLRFNDAVTVIDVLHHRLFAVDILARIHRIDGDSLVPVVRRPNNDGVDIFARQHLAIIACGEHVVTPELLSALAAAVIAVAHCEQFDASNEQRVFGVAASLATRSDQCDLDGVVNGNFLGRLRQQSSGYSCTGGGTQKMASGGGHVEKLLPQYHPSRYRLRSSIRKQCAKAVSR